ncbi:hypothetical protein Aph01nite_69410 [Acrocarpospora phusangensis]|uniref:Ig-like domain-containing protein n=1 Tax=Acrocarpospora phusangensis TaxID=1070424 RepID=A0A919QGZ6_9ACTN|nr:hypothetical protein [Acrocarpospora phusangensis]GIH28631.1 hypothetical protein Aph01nite_69410 [Acrocarpospora phusangensis]
MRSRRTGTLLLTSLLISTTLAVLPQTAQAANASVVSAESWTYVTKDLPDETHWNATPFALTGYVPGGLSRSFYRFDLSELRHRAETGWFRNVLHGGTGCPAALELWETGTVTPQTTWRNQPRWLKKLASVRFTENCAEQIVEWPLTGLPDRKKITVGLRLADEKATGTAFLFRAGTAALQFGNTRPGKPTRLWLPAHDGCGFSQPILEKLSATNVLTPTFNALLTDRDTGQALRAHFEWRTTGGPLIAAQKTAFGPADQPKCVTVPKGQLTESGSYQWRVRADDGTALSPWSDWYPFTVDMKPPDRAPIVSSPDYPEGQSAGRIGQPGTFTFDPDGVPDIAFYCCDADSNFTTSPTVTLKPLSAGPQSLRVRSFDAAANPSPATDYSYSVNDVPLPVINSPDYPEFEYAGSPGTPGTFTFTGNGLADLITHYAYRLDPPDDPWTTIPAPDGTATTTITPTAPDAHILRVEALDRDGDTIWSTTYSFNVNP